MQMRSESRAGLNKDDDVMEENKQQNTGKDNKTDRQQCRSQTTLCCRERNNYTAPEIVRDVPPVKSFDPLNLCLTF